MTGPRKRRLWLTIGILVSAPLAIIATCQLTLDDLPRRFKIPLTIDISTPDSSDNAMLFKPLLGSQLSGSIAGITASHNAGGAYFRQRSTPTNPATSFQQTIRNAMAILTTRWLDELTPAQRDAWQTYADNVTLTNRIGDPINVSGQNMYVRSNITTIQIGQVVIDDAPIVFNLGSFTEPAIDDADGGSQLVTISFDANDAWANEDDSHMVIYISRPQNQSINFFKGPYQLAGTIDGNATTPPTSPETFTAPFTISVGQVVFVQIRVHRADGRLSGVFRTSKVVTAA